MSKKPKANSSSTFVQAASPHSSSCVITSECGRGDEGMRQRGRCTRWHAGGGTRKKYTRNGDPEDTKVERKGKQRIVGLPVDMDEGSLHGILLCIHYFRCRQTTWRQQYAKLTTRPHRQILQASASHFLQRTCFGSSLFSTLFPLHSLCCFGLWSQNLWWSTRLKKRHITKAFFIPAFEQSWHFTYIRNTHQLKGFTRQTYSPWAIISVMDSLLNLCASKGRIVDT